MLVCDVEGQPKSEFNQCGSWTEKVWRTQVAEEVIQVISSPDENTNSSCAAAGLSFLVSYCRLQSDSRCSDVSCVYIIFDDVILLSHSWSPSVLCVSPAGRCGQGVVVQTIMPFALAAEQEVCVWASLVGSAGMNMPLHQISVIPRDVTSSRVSGSGKAKDKDKQVCGRGHSWGSWAGLIPESAVFILQRYSIIARGEFWS